MTPSVAWTGALAFLLALPVLGQTNATPDAGGWREVSCCGTRAA